MKWRSTPAAPSTTHPTTNEKNMQFMTADEAREAFLKYYQERDHLRLPSASLIPSGDPTLLLTSAGMVPFKPYFSRELEPPYPRVTTVQKSFRTTDIEEVGDATHLTMFEMLGNFSFGDYFKKEAIEWGHDISLNVYGLDPERLFYTVYTDDDEAEQLWVDRGVARERIYRFGDSDNWWGPAGDQGACGPSSELHYYSGDLAAIPDYSDPEIRQVWGPNLTDDFVEYYNLVFTQFNRDLEGIDTPLPFKNIDTGLGLERIAVILQDVKSIYEVDHFQPLIRHIEGMCGKKWGDDPRVTMAINIVAEHARSAAFLIGDGVIPGNSGRGYVLRRVIRRGMLFGRELGVEGLISEVAKVVADVMGHTYPELRTNGSFIEQVLEREESSFARTLEQGTERLHTVIARPDDQIVISGADAAQLYDTYGFPVEMTQEIAGQNGLSVDMEGFEREMEERREKARSAGTAFIGGAEERKVYESLGIDETVFLGYNTLIADSTIVGLIREGKVVDSAAEGEEVEIVLDETPFYAARGGQLGDTGTLQSLGTAPVIKIEVDDTRAPFGHINVHFSKVMKGLVKIGDALTAQVDVDRREKIMRNHTATHLVHAALREVLGTHVRQSGSVVAPDHLRFDFTHMAAMTPDEIKAVQDRVNEKIRTNRPVEVHWMLYSKAVEEGALAFFGDTYENEVRTVRIDPPWSYELCGGTHMESTGGIGVFIITSEAGIGSGVRRLVAVTGVGAEDAIYDRFGTVNQMSQLLKAPGEELSQRTQSLIEDLAASRREVQKLEEQVLRASVAGTPNGAGQKTFDFTLDGPDGNLITAEVKSIPASNIDALRRTADHIRDRMKCGVVVLGAVIDQRPMIVVMVTKDLTKHGLNAGDIAKAIAGKMGGGGGGGSAAVAQAGGKEPEQLESALESVREVIEAALAGAQT
jgi:alanyl-tRNA synthetase